MRNGGAAHKLNSAADFINTIKGSWFRGAVMDGDSSYGSVGDKVHGSEKPKRIETVAITP